LGAFSKQKEGSGKPLGFFCADTAGIVRGRGFFICWPDCLIGPLKASNFFFESPKLREHPELT